MVTPSKETFPPVAWLLIPTIYLLACWLLVFNPEKILEIFPTFGFGSDVSVSDVLPLHPKSFVEAYMLGNFAAKIELLEETSSQAMEVLKEASDLMGRSVLKADIMKAYDHIVEMDKDQGIIASTTGMFNFINFIWLISIVGILVVIGPMLKFLIDPVIRILVNVFTNVIIPFLVMVEKNGGFVVLGYFVCFYIEIIALKYKPEVGFYIAALGSGLAIPLFLYAASRASTGQPVNKAFLILLNVYIALVFAPFAISYQSDLLGIITVMASYHALGFTVFCMGLCWVIGFDDKHTMQRVVAQSYIVVIFCIIAKITGFSSNYYFKPFAQGLSVMGPLTLFLGLLISSFNWHGNDVYIKSNVLFVVTALVFIFASNVLGLVSIRNTTYTMFCIWTCEKFSELNIWKNDGWAYVGMFLFFVVLFQTSLFLNTHPQYIVGMFDSSWLTNPMISPIEIKIA